MTSRTKDEDFTGLLDEDRLSWRRHEEDAQHSQEYENILQDDLREDCMKSSIRTYITTLVDTLPFTSSEIPDRIIVEGIATSKESESLRKLKTTDDQVSGLVSMVITKDYKAMERFLTIVAVHNAEVVDKIRDMFNDMLEEPIGAAKPCVVCNLKEKCDVKSVYNHFFAKGHNSADLHRRIVHSELLVGSQDRLWSDMFNALRSTPDCVVIRVLVEAMEHDGCCNSNLIQMLRRLLRKNEQLKCSCNARIELIPSSSTLPSSKNSNNSQVYKSELRQAPVATSLGTISENCFPSPEDIYYNKTKHMSMPIAIRKRIYPPEPKLSTYGLGYENIDPTTNNNTNDARKEPTDSRARYKRPKPNDS